MFKKLFSFILTLCLINLSFLPALAEGENYESTHIIDAQFKTDLNVNKASKGQVIQFVSTEDYNVDGVLIPKGTVFNGEVTHAKKSRFGYRRAKAVIKINQIILPDGETMNIKAATKRRVLKGSALVNIGKGIVSAPVAIVVGVAGAVVILVEAISIVGIIAIGPTSYLFGETMGKLTHGVNCKKYRGDEIKLRIKSL